MPTLTALRPRFGEIRRRLAGRDVARHERQVRVGGPDAPHAGDDPLRMPVGGIHHQGVHPGRDQRVDPFVGIRTGAHRGAHPQPAWSSLQAFG